jgi:hypothetical protein
MVALHYKKGDEVIRLHVEAIADFERKRVQVLNPALVSSPRAMELNLPPIASSPIAGAEIPSLEPVDLVDLGEENLDQAFPAKPVPVRPIIAPSSAKPQAPQVKRQPATTPGKTMVLQDGGHPHAMEPQLPPIAVPEPGDLEDFPDFVEEDATENVANKPVLAKPVIAARGLATKQPPMIMRRRPNAPSPPEKKFLLMRRGPKPPPPEKKFLMTRRWPGSPPRPTGRPHAVKQPPIAEPDLYEVEDFSTWTTPP